MKAICHKRDQPNQRQFDHVRICIFTGMWANAIIRDWLADVTDSESLATAIAEVDATIDSISAATTQAYPVTLVGTPTGSAEII